jgi:hypothetical protein
MPEAPRTRIGVGVDARKLWAGGAVGTLVGGVAARSTSPYNRISHH